MKEKDKPVVLNPSADEIESKRKAKLTPASTVKREELPSSNPFEPKAYSFKLASGTNAIKEGTIFIRRMTTIEEGILQTRMSELKDSKAKFTLQSFLNIFTDIIKNCVKSDVNIAKLSFIDKLPIIIEIINMTYGSKVKTEVSCAYCNKEQIVESDVRDSEYIITPDNFVPRTIKLTTFEFPITATLKMPLVEDEANFYGDNINLVNQIACVIESISGVKPDGEQLTNDDIEEVVKYMGAEDKDEIRKFISELLDMGNTLKATFECDNPECPSKKKKKEKIQTYEIPTQSIFNKLL